MAAGKAVAKMKKRHAVMFVVGLLAVTMWPAKTSAHVLEIDDTLGAVLHVLPDDSPVSGKPTGYELAFKDTDGTFSLKHCDCTVAIVKNGKQIARQPLHADGALQSNNVATFPEAGAYQLVVSGRPVNGAKFSPFTLTYLLRVGDGSVQTQAMPTLLWVGMAGVIGLVLLAAYASEISYTTRK